MTLYQIGGLGADERVFKYLNLNCVTKVINWIDPESDEDLRSYAIRLFDQIDQTEEFGLLGVSFGGIVAIEMAKLCEPKKLILISSVALSDQLPTRYISLGRMGFLAMLPDFFLKPPKPLLGLLFGTEHKKILCEIIRDTKPTFMRWALSQIVNWSNRENSINPTRIHGTNDRLIPLKGDAIKVENGGHFMIVDKAKEISKLVNEQMRYAG